MVGGECFAYAGMKLFGSVDVPGKAEVAIPKTAVSPHKSFKRFVPVGFVGSTSAANA
jgi:hypothetical protein